MDRRRHACTMGGTAITVTQSPGGGSLIFGGSASIRAPALLNGWNRWPRNERVPTMRSLLAVLIFVLLAVAQPARHSAAELPVLHLYARSEERRVGKEGVSTCRYRWPPCH